MAAKLNTTLHQQRLRAPENTQDASEETPVWEHLRRFKAEVAPLGAGSELLNHNTLKPIQRFRIKVRYLEDISTSDRLVDVRDGDVYHVEAASPENGKGHWTIIEAREWQS